MDRAIGGAGCTAGLRRVAIVGTRAPSLAQIAKVFHIVAATGPDVTIVSGGASGIDTWARRAAQFYRRACTEHLPTKYAPKHATKAAYVDALFRRNEDIVRDSHETFAMPGPEYPYRGGTLHTIKRTRVARHPLTIFRYPDARQIEPEPAP